MNLKDPQQRGEAISAYLDGELTPDELAAFERFLETSPEARAEVQQMRQVVQQVAALPRSTAPPDMRAAIQEQIASPAVVTTRFPLAYRMGLGLAAAIATVFVALRFTSDTVPLASFDTKARRPSGCMRTTIGWPPTSTSWIFDRVAASMTCTVEPPELLTRRNRPSGVAVAAKGPGPTSGVRCTTENDAVLIQASSLEPLQATT